MAVLQYSSLEDIQNGVVPRLDCRDHDGSGGSQDAPRVLDMVRSTQTQIRANANILNDPCDPWGCYGRG